MSKTAACIKMLELLNTKSVISATELAELINVNKRNITEYIKELQMAGYSIETVRGKYGGYRLESKSLFPVLKLNNNEKATLQNAMIYLKEKPDYFYYSDFIGVVGKILSSVYQASTIEPIKMIDKFPLQMPKEELQERYNKLNEALSTYNKCKISYLSTANKVKVHLIHPYKLYIYNGSWFILAWNETINDFGYFKLNRIQTIEKQKEHFTILKTYRESDYLDSFGMKQNGDYYHVKLKLKDLYAVLIERTYGKNQVITRLDEHYTILECDMQNKSVIMSFVLGFASKCEVIEPQWLRDEVKQELLKIATLYQGDVNND